MKNLLIERLSPKIFFERKNRFMIGSLSILISGLIFISPLLVCSVGRQVPFLDDEGKFLEGSISEKIHVNINGVQQGMFIKSKDISKPVLLFLHGGPGMPEYAISRKYPTVLENYFTVCYWDQRGSGLSYNTENSTETITFDQLISDTLAVTDYLRKRFNQEKIYLMGHSGGTFIGIQAANKAPELYHAYIAISQISKQFESEKIAYQYMMKEFAINGDTKSLKKLEQIPLIELEQMPPSYRSLRDESMHKLGIGTTHEMKSVLSGIFLPVMLNQEYSFIEKLNIWRGKWSANSTDLWNTILATNLTTEVTELNIPIYFCEGIYDYTCSYSLAKDYFLKLKAPVKGFYTFYQSAHSPLFEEPEKMKHILHDDILNGETNLADTDF